MNQRQKFKSKSSQPVFAKKSFGQNFLVDQNYVHKIVAALDPQPGETIVEIGAGRGALTGQLVASGANVIAIELDKDLIPLLQNEFAHKENFELIEADALQVNFNEIVRNSKFKTQDRRAESEINYQSLKARLVANLPYYISTAILQKLLDARACFSELILMLQREVVERITAEPGESERGFLSVLVEAYTQAEKLFDVPPTAFRPVPKVWSSIVKLEIKEKRLITSSEENEKNLWQIVSACFLQRRKTILNNMRSLPPKIRTMIEAKESESHILELAGIEPARRSETLTLDEWIRLAQIINPN